MVAGVDGGSAGKQELDGVKLVKGDSLPDGRAEVGVTDVGSVGEQEGDRVEVPVLGRDVGRAVALRIAEGGADSVGKQ